jgi:hypothetical protein
VETKWHGAVLDLITMLYGTFVLPQMLADGSYWGMALYQGIPFEIREGISVLRCLWVQCEDGSVHRVLYWGSECNIK